MADIATQTINRAGLTHTAGAIASGDKFVPDKDTFVVLNNTSGVLRTGTFVSPATTPDGLAIEDPAINLPIGVNKMYGPFPAETFADPTDGKCTITLNGSGVTASVIKLSR